MKLKGAIATAFMLGGILFGATGCLNNKATEPLKDAPTGARNQDPADIMSFPDGFSNVATKCDGPNRVYVAFKGDENRAAIAVVPNDPRCSGGHG